VSQRTKQKEKKQKVESEKGVISLIEQEMCSKGEFRGKERSGKRKSNQAL